VKVVDMRVDAHLIEMLKQKDEEAFELIYNEYSNLIYYIAYSIVKNKEDAEEVVQDTFLNMLKSIETYNGNNKFKQWLMQIARNLSYNKVTRNKEKYTIRDDKIITTIKAPRENTDLLLTIRGLLDLESSHIVILRIVYDFSFKEIAEDCKLTVNKVQGIYYQSLKKLKKEFRYE
jgi:RNA polymerase sigma-70 factor (ECF subfamily)